MHKLNIKANSYLNLEEYIFIKNKRKEIIQYMNFLDQLYFLSTNSKDGNKELRKIIHHNNKFCFLQCSRCGNQDIFYVKEGSFKKSIKLLQNAIEILKEQKNQKIEPTFSKLFIQTVDKEIVAINEYICNIEKYCMELENFAETSSKIQSLCLKYIDIFQNEKNKEVFNNSVDTFILKLQKIKNK